MKLIRFLVGLGFSTRKKYYKLYATGTFLLWVYKLATMALNEMKNNDEIPNSLGALCCAS